MQVEIPDPVLGNGIWSYTDAEYAKLFSEKESGD